MSAVHADGIFSPEAAIAPAGEPCWEVALLFPKRGNWTETDYLALDTSYLVELSNGSIEVLPMADWPHQFIVGFMYRVLDAFVVARQLGKVAFAPLPVRLWPEKMREPDLSSSEANVRGLANTPTAPIWLWKS